MKILPIAYNNITFKSKIKIDPQKVAVETNKFVLNEIKSKNNDNFPYATKEDYEILTATDINAPLKRAKWFNPRDLKTYWLIKENQNDDGSYNIRILDENAKFIKNATIPELVVLIPDYYGIYKEDYFEMCDEISHGDRVLRFAQVTNPFAKYVRFKRGLEASDDPRKVKISDITSQSKPSGINFSFSHPFPIKHYEQLKDKSSKDILEFINNNIDIRKENPEDQECFYGTEDAVKLIDDMNLLAQSGIDFFTSAGNDGKDYFNLFQLAENIHGVGSLDARGKISSFSSSRKFPLTFHYELGEHRIKKTKEGINYTGGNHTDFICDLNDYYPLSGKSATGRIVSQKEFERYLYYSQTDNKKKGELLGLWKKQGKLLSEDLMLEMNDEESEINRNWVYYDINGLVPYVINKNNILEPYLGWVDGTSFAAPKRTARYALNKAMEGVL